MSEEVAPAPWNTLHPASVAVNLIPTAWRVVKSLWPLLLAAVVGSRSATGMGSFEVGLLGFFFIMPVWRTIWHWFTLRYRVSDGRLEIRSGMLYRQVRVIPPERIQNVELVRNVFHRMSGLVELKVETASGTEIEGQLSALSEAEAHALMEALDKARKRVRPDPTEEIDRPALVENSLVDLLRYGLSTARLGLVVVAMGVIYEAILSLDPTSGAQTAAMALGTVGTAAGLVVLVLGAWILGAGASVVRHWNFRLSMGTGTLVAEEGLFTRRRVELAQPKIQLATLSQSFIRRAMGFGVLHLETAAAREDAGGTMTAEAVVPVLAEDRFVPVLTAALPDVPDLAGIALNPPHPKAVLRAMLQTAVRTTLLAAFLAWVFQPAGVIAFALVPMGLFATWFDHRHQGWWVGERYVVAREGWWVRQTRIVARDKLQSLQLSQGPIARRWNLARLRLRVAGSSVVLPVLSFDDALDLELDLSERIAPRSFGSAVPAALPVVPPALDTQRAGLIDDDERRAQHQDPGDGLGHARADEEQRVEEDPTAPGARPRIQRPAEQRGEPHPDDDERSHGEHEADGRALAVEARFPQQVEPRLHHDDEALDDDEEPERDVHAGDEDPHGRV
jgi:putative membrane protein